jgi:aspartate/methionine/tyrosine aminotransferase
VWFRCSEPTAQEEEDLLHRKQQTTTKQQEARRMYNHYYGSMTSDEQNNHESTPQQEEERGQQEGGILAADGHSPAATAAILVDEDEPKVLAGRARSSISNSGRIPARQPPPLSQQRLGSRGLLAVVAVFVVSCSLLLAFGILISMILTLATPMISSPTLSDHHQKPIPTSMILSEMMATTTTTRRSSPKFTTSSSSTSTLALSTRGQGVHSGRDDLEVFRVAKSDPYHPVDNPNGYLVMLVAENKLMWTEMAHRLEAVQCPATPSSSASSSSSHQKSSPLHIPEWTFLYGDMGGHIDFKRAMANLMQRWIIGPHVDPDQLRFQAGAGSVLDQLSYLLADTGDGVLVTAPHYGAFGGDFAVYGQTILHTCPTRAEHGYAPTTADLDECHDRAVAAGNPPKILIICQPNNPTGIIYNYQTMHLMITWALHKHLHVVSDEIYALSVFPGQKTISAAQIMADLHAAQASDHDHNNDDDHKHHDHYLGDYVHIVAGLSKDWGMSGFRVGTLFSHNAGLLAALDGLGYYQSVSQYTQWTLTQVFSAVTDDDDDDHDSNDVWLDWYIRENQQRIYDTYQALVAALALVDIPLLIHPTQQGGGLFVWADFSSWLLPDQTERELWLELFTTSKIALTTGASCDGEKPGLFRIVYTWPEGGPVAMRELGQRLVRFQTERRGGKQDEREDRKGE